MDCYVVRIYRRQEHGSHAFVGLLEEVGKQGNRAFSSIEELYELMAQGEKSCHKKTSLKKKHCERIKQGQLK